METGKSVRNGCNTIPEILRLTILFGWLVFSGLTPLMQAMQGRK